MPFNANNFRSTLQYGGARPNMFEIILVKPPTTFTKQAITSTGVDNQAGTGRTSEKATTGNVLNVGDNLRVTISADGEVGLDTGAGSFNLNGKIKCFSLLNPR